MTQADDQLLKLSAAGDEAAFAALYDRHQAGVYRFVLFLSGSATAAEEITQEVFVALIRDVSRFDPARGSMGAFLCGVARNLLRRQRLRDRLLVPLDRDRGWAAEGDAHQDLAAAEQAEALRRAVLALPPRYREVVTLCHIEGRSYQDAAERLDCSTGTVCSRLNRARALLLHKLSPAMRGCEPCLKTI